jgi:HK97 gp10 family phage protein
MASITVDIKGMSEALGKFDKYSKKVQTEIKDEVNASALAIQSNAKKMAPVNLGMLRNSIYLTGESKGQFAFMYSVGAGAKYAPYIEFGTGGKVRIPAGYESYASTFKTKTGGAFKDMIEALMQWGIRMGYIKSGKGARQHAYFMARKILAKGLRPQPFLIPAFEQEKPKLKLRIEKIIKNA